MKFLKKYPKKWGGIALFSNPLVLHPILLPRLFKSNLKIFGRNKDAVIMGVKISHLVTTF